MSSRDAFMEQLLEARQRLMDLGLTEEEAQKQALQYVREHEPEMYEQLTEWMISGMLQESLIRLEQDGKVKLKLAKLSDGDYEWQVDRLVQ